MATQQIAPPAETVSAAPRAEDLAELELDWSVPVLKLWDGQVVEAE